MKYLSLVSCLVVALFTSTVVSQASSCVDDHDETIQLRNGSHINSMERIASYVAHISERDLINSKGERLTGFRHVLSQDRSNVHKTGILDEKGDFGDRNDDFFTSLKKRKLFLTADIYYYCYLDEAAVASIKKQIVDGQVPGFVSVMIFKKTNGDIALFLSTVG